MLVSELERHQYVASTFANKDGSSTATPPRDGKRKIDHILFRNSADFTLVSNISMLDYKRACLIYVAVH